MNQKTILIVDDEASVRYSFQKLFREPGTTISEASNGAEAIAFVQKTETDLVLLDIEMPGLTGLETIQRLKVLQADLPVIIMTAYGSSERVIAAMKYGAFDYLEKPFDIDRLKTVVKEALALKASSQTDAKIDIQPAPLADSTLIVGQSQAIKEVYKMIGRVAASDVSVLITGESGTGKELMAKAVHRFSDRADKPFIAINCAAIPDNLLESELFGYEKGAFTDASQSKAGKFEAADKGTLFLDEIADMSINLQAKLLRVLQEGTFERVGSNKTQYVDVRIISATNKNLENAIAEKQFREDLYYRLKVVNITIPPLRMHKEDIPLLVNHFLAKQSREMRKSQVTVLPEAMQKMMNHNWPGNVRELENTLKRALLLSKNNLITPDLLNNEPAEVTSSIGLSVRSGYIPEDFEQHEGTLYKFVVEQLEKDLIQRVLTYHKGNQVKTAKTLGISRATLLERMEKYNISHD
jgi:DNA-binding NtrC family response regulator